MADKTYKDIVVGYADNHKMYTYKFYNTETKRIILTRDVKWAEWKMTDPAENVKMLRDSHKEDFVPGIDEDKNPTSEPEDNPEDNIPLHVIPDEGETVRPNEKSKSS